MSKRSNDIRLRHMLDHAQETMALAEGRARGDLDEDRLLEIVGEAASRIPEEERARHPEIP